MNTVFMNTENSKTSKPHVFTLKLTDTWKNIKSSYNNNKFKISALTWNDEFK